MPDAVVQAQSHLALLLTSMSCGVGHIAGGYEKVLRQGLRGLIEEAQRRLHAVPRADARLSGKRHFYRAVIIACRAAVAFARRYSDLARGLAEIERRPERRRELERVAGICLRVPELPARSFYEALQSFWFVHLIIQIESNGHSISPGTIRSVHVPLLPARHGSRSAGSPL